MRQEDERVKIKGRVYVTVVGTALVYGGGGGGRDINRAANCYDFGVAATLFNPDYAATLVTSMLRL